MRLTTVIQFTEEIVFFFFFQSRAQLDKTSFSVSLCQGPHSPRPYFPWGSCFMCMRVVSILSSYLVWAQDQKIHKRHSTLRPQIRDWQSIGPRLNSSLLRVKPSYTCSYVLSLTAFMLQSIELLKQRTTWALKPTNIYYLALYRRCLLIPALNHKDYQKHQQLLPFSKFSDAFQRNFDSRWFSCIIWGDFLGCLVYHIARRWN